MYSHLIKYIDQKQINQLLAEILPFFEHDPKSLGLSQDQAGIEYDLTSSQVIPTYVNLIEQLCSQYINKKVQCQNYWISVSRPGTSVVSHNHKDQSNCDFSAIIYVCADEHSGQLQLEDYSASLTLSSGDIVLFPIQCYHSVTENKSSHDRICVAFDLQQAG